MRVWGKVGVGCALLDGERTRGGWADVDRFRMGRNHGWWRGDVQRDGIRRDATVHVGIRWVMAMRAGLGPTSRVLVVIRRRGYTRRLLALWRPSTIGSSRRLSRRDGHVRTAIGIS
jgi:hypothetical protein